MRGGGGMPPTHHAQLAPGVGVADHRSRIIRKHARHRCEVADIAVDDAEQRDDRGLVGGDAVEIAHVYVERARIEQAKALIVSAEISLANIAQAVGFADQSHFSRRFRAHEGRTPAQFAREQASGILPSN